MSLIKVLNDNLSTDTTCNTDVLSTTGTVVLYYYCTVVLCWYDNLALILLTVKDRFHVTVTTTTTYCLYEYLIPGTWYMMQFMTRRS